MTFGHAFVAVLMMYLCGAVIGLVTLGPLVTGRKVSPGHMALTVVMNLLGIAALFTMASAIMISSK